MKKNITINLYGSLYAIDEDAYELLKRYEDNLRAYFSRQADGQEIADDIERRVADLFEELKAQGVEAITIEHVQDIITRLGKPEEMAGEAEDGAREAFGGGEAAEGGGQPKKKFFRDPNDKMLGGVKKHSEKSGVPVKHLHSSSASALKNLPRDGRLSK